MLQKKMLRGLGTVALVLAVASTSYAQTPTVTVPVPGQVPVANNPAAVPPAGTTTNVTVSIPTGGVASPNNPFQVEANVVIEVAGSQLGQEMDITVPVQGGPITANPTAVPGGSTATVPITWQISKKDLIAALQLQIAKLQLNLADINNTITGLFENYTELTPERALTIILLQQQAALIQADINALNSRIAEAQAGDFTNFGATGFQVVQKYQGAITVPPGQPKITVTSTAGAAVPVPLQ